MKEKSLFFTFTNNSTRTLIDDLFLTLYLTLGKKFDASTSKDYEFKLFWVTLLIIVIDKFLRFQKYFWIKLNVDSKLLFQKKILWAPFKKPVLDLVFLDSRLSCCCFKAENIFLAEAVLLSIVEVN